MFSSQLYALIVYFIVLVMCFSCKVFGAATEIDPLLQLRLQKVAQENKLDPELIQAIAFVESKYDPAVVGLAGERGILQMHPKYHADLSLRAAGRYLAELRTRCKGLGPAWFVCYNYGPNKALRLDAPRQTQYYQRVTKAYIEIHRRRFMEASLP